MSVEAYTWALNLAPVPMDISARRSSPNSACAFVLVALANHADPDGRNAFPGVDTIVRYTRLAERTVRTALDRLEELGVIVPCDPAILAAKIKRADRRPNGFDLNYEMVRDDLTDDEMDKIGKDNPWLRPWIEQHRAERGATVAPRERGATVAPRETDGVQPTRHGVQPTQSRGAAVAPEPSLEPSIEPTPKKPSVTADAATPDDGGFVLISMPPPAPAFDEFWEHYPRSRRVGKGDARKAFERACKRASTERIVAGVRRFAADPNLPSGDEVQFIPHPATWLNQDRWDDPPLPLRVPAARNNGFTHQHTQDNSGRERPW